MDISSLDQVVANNLCIGCGICQSIAGPDRVKIEFDDQGFLSPTVVKDYSDVWDVIKGVCPGLTVKRDRPPEDNAYHELWGSFVKIQAGHATDSDLRWVGSSGGAISATLCYLLESGRVDEIIQIGPDLSDPVLNQVYRNDNCQGVQNCAGSRYAPAAPLVNIIDILEAGDRRFAIVGKPCDIAALSAYLNHQPDMKDKVECLLSFFCAGTSSMKATHKLLTMMDTKRADVAKLSYRGQGWPGRMMTTDKDGTKSFLDYEISWGKILNRHLHFRCRICADSIGELADIVCADGWYLKNGKPDFENRSDRPGRSLIITRTEVGRDIVFQAQKDGYLALESMKSSCIIQMQPFQAQRRRQAASTLLAMRLAGATYTKYSGFQHLVPGLRQFSAESLSAFEGIILHLAGKRDSFRLDALLKAVRGFRKCINVVTQLRSQSLPVRNDQIS